MSIQTIEREGEKWLCIDHVNQMRPFFMSVVSHSNHWMFISSNGGLSAGRKNADFSLFPYYTDDKITEMAPITGSKTLIRVKKGDSSLLWEAFSTNMLQSYTIQRNLYKNSLGNKIRFEETNVDLKLTFCYEWNSSQRFGFVKKAWVINNDAEPQQVEVLDGLQNIIPAGVGSDLQNRSSNLVDAYKRHELIEESGLAVYALSAFIVDKAEPSEALKSNVAWSYGFENPTHLLSSLQLQAFASNQPIRKETDIKGEKGAYFVHESLELAPNQTKEWGIVANVNQDHADVIALNELILNEKALVDHIHEDIDEGSAKLKALVASADGIQHTSDDLTDARHYANVLFNIMRGGIFDQQYTIEKSDFVKYLKGANRDVFAQQQAFITTLPATFSYLELVDHAQKSENADLIRLSTEYLPLKFSRRHGDPSRPWNRFSINTQSEVDGSKILDYEGNWRDIFQNWEALAVSYPAFLKGMIYKFLNASTADGYNPYRITKGGIDWETIEPDDPWSYIGYWGDHQIIYLLKFLELSDKFDPSLLPSICNQQNFVYANVPYRIKAYAQILENPKDTIEFDLQTDEKVRALMEELGADGACLQNAKGQLQYASFMEKILATLLAKLSNFVPEGGIWMNTQRPEWNDANNALVGNGISMVTLYYLRRFILFFEQLVEKIPAQDFQVSEEIQQLFDQIHQVFTRFETGLNDQQRKQMVDALGQAGSKYRQKVYASGMSGNQGAVSTSDLARFFKQSLIWIDQSIKANERTDGLFHAYNLLQVEQDAMQVLHLDEMLEGQVAVLSSGYLNPEQSLKVLDAMRKSALYRADQNSYILYPNKDIAGFLKRNNIPKEQAEASALINKLVEQGNRQVVVKDLKGGYHFNGEFHNVKDLKSALEQLDPQHYGKLIEQEKESLYKLFEQVFNHKAFTGRSGTFFGYEGLGSIYWHMVSKLYLAVAEVVEQALSEDVPKAVLEPLMYHFEQIGDGIGVHKDPKVYGAFPTDPYSHTPAHRGAQQPGMTGQVKEDILVRFIQLGVNVQEGILTFDPKMLSVKDFNAAESVYEYVRKDQQAVQLSLPAGSLAFTLCQTPVVYQLSDTAASEVYYYQQPTQKMEGLKLDADSSAAIFDRSPEIEKVVVYLPKELLWKTS